MQGELGDISKGQCSYQFKKDWQRKDRCKKRRGFDQNKRTKSIYRQPYEVQKKSVWLWEKKNGKKPKGAVVFFKDGNNQNFDENNLACISRAELLYINRKKYKGIPDKLKPTLFMVAKLMVAAGRKVGNKNC